MRTLESALKITFSSASKMCEAPSDWGDASGPCLQVEANKNKTKQYKKKREKQFLSFRRLSGIRDGNKGLILAFLSGYRLIYYMHLTLFGSLSIKITKERLILAALAFRAFKFPVFPLFQGKR